MKKINVFVATAMLGGLLTACGGGGGDSAPAPAAAAPAGGTPSAAPSANTGSVSAPFVAAGGRYVLFGQAGSLRSGPLPPVTQGADGAITTVGSIALSGAAVVKDISGNANLAQGRWAAGTVTDGTGAEVLSGTDGKAYHYQAFHELAVFPTSGNTTCDAGAFTMPTYSAGSPATSATGISTGNASLTFGPGGAAVTGSINTAVNGVAATVNLNMTVNSPGFHIKGSFLSGGPGYSVSMGSDGASGYTVLVAYVAGMPSGQNFLGVANFHCK